MNLGDESDSPWSDQRSNSPHKAASNDQDDDARAPSTAATAASPQSPAASTVPIVKSPGGGRTSRAPRRYGAQPTRLEAVDSSLDPLGPLGAKAQTEPEPDIRPELPQKEHAPLAPAASQPQPSQAQRGRSALSPQHGDADDGDDQERPSLASRTAAPAFQPAAPDSSQRQAQPSASVEQAARPTFHITVGDPHKVGDLTSSHTVYQVRTKTNSKAFRVPEFEVSRRYRDFLWLYNQLHSNNPGIVVPPPPEKQITGRFDTDFVEQRRAALERMLNKTASHVVLQHDTDVKIFLESESFNVDVKNRERKDSDMPESKGMFSSLNLSVGSGTKFIETDDWFLDRRVYLETLETQLKGLLKATDTAVAQRRALSEASSDLSISLNTLAQVELSPSLSGPLASLSDLHLRVRDLYARQAQQDVLTLSTTIDEYIRLIGSIKKAFEQRQRSWQLWHNAESDLLKRRSALDKLAKQGRSQQDRISQLQADVADAERRSHQARLTFEDLGRGMRAELERFEREKVEDFRMGVETYLESAVEAQKELIELWETYLMHFDADEFDEQDDPTAPPYPLQNAAAAGAAAAAAQHKQQQQSSAFAAASSTAAAGADGSGGDRQARTDGADDGRDRVAAGDVSASAGGGAGRVEPPLPASAGAAAAVERA